MQTDINREWWKRKVYTEISNYLRHPNTSSRRQLDSALLEYEKIFSRLTLSSDVNTLNAMELSMNEF